MKIAIFCLLILMANTGQAVEILIGRNAHHGYRTFLDGRDPTLITDYRDIESNREVVELVLLHQALRLGGYDEPIELVVQHLEYLRSIRIIANGSYPLWANSVWRSDAQEMANSLYLTKPVVQRGEYLVGLYTHPSNSKALAAQTLQDVQQLAALSNENFSVDWKTLQSLDLRAIYSNPNWYSYGKALANNRADFMLTPFQPTAGQVFLHKEYTKNDEVEVTVVLVPIPNLQVYLDGSRHWIISKKHPEGEKLFQALEKGLAILEQTGQRKKALLQSGFIPDDSDSKLTLNPEQLTVVP